MLIACVDSLTGFPEAIEAVYPDTRPVYRPPGASLDEICAVEGLQACHRRSETDLPITDRGRSHTSAQRLFMQNLLCMVHEKILLLNPVIFWGDYQSLQFMYIHWLTANFVWIYSI